MIRAGDIKTIDLTQDPDDADWIRRVPGYDDDKLSANLNVKQTDLDAQVRKMPEWRRKAVRQRVKDWKDAEAKMLDRKEARFLEGESAKP